MKIQYNKRNLEEYKMEFFKRFPDSKLEILEFLDNYYVLVKYNEDLFKFPKKTLLSGSKPSINSALNKTEYFINKLKNIYKNYDFTFTNYLNYKTKIQVICNKHGEFYQRSDHLLNGIGCPKCGRTITADFIKQNPMGWNYTNWIKASKTSKHFDSFKVYIIECWNDEERFYKIGKTFCKVKKRFDWKHSMPYNYKIIKLFVGEAREISELEQKLKMINKINKYKPKINFQGSYECFIKIENYEKLFT